MNVQSVQASSLADLSFISASELLHDQLLSFADFAKMNLLISMRANDVEYTILQQKRTFLTFPVNSFHSFYSKTKRNFF